MLCPSTLAALVNLIVAAVESVMLPANTWKEIDTELLHCKQEDAREVLGETTSICCEYYGARRAGSCSPTVRVTPAME